MFVNTIEPFATELLEQFFASKRQGTLGVAGVDIDDVEGVVELVLAKAERLDVILARVHADAVGGA